MGSKKATPAGKAKLLFDNAVQLAEFAATALIAAEQLWIKTKPLENLTLTPAQREVLLAVPQISMSLKNKLVNDQVSFSVADVASITLALAEHLTDAGLAQQVALLHLGKHLIDELHSYIAHTGKFAFQHSKPPKVKSPPDIVYQFKITLIDSEPPIWRRIQVEDCTLDSLHEHIQTAMGWTNSHLHRFEIFKKQYGDPELLDDGFDDFKCIDSTRTKLSQIIPDAGKRFKFTYEYDFGDDWEHEILFEGSKKKELGKKYPICLEGALACPPEDVGGIFGYHEFLEALADPEHEQHDDFIEWGGNFDPEEFDAKKATREMKKGYPIGEINSHLLLMFVEHLPLGTSNRAFIRGKDQGCHP